MTVNLKKLMTAMKNVEKSLWDLELELDDSEMEKEFSRPGNKSYYEQLCGDYSSEHLRSGLKKFIKDIGHENALGFLLYFFHTAVEMKMINAEACFLLWPEDEDSLDDPEEIRTPLSYTFSEQDYAVFNVKKDPPKKGYVFHDLTFTIKEKPVRKKK